MAPIPALHRIASAAKSSRRRWRIARLRTACSSSMAFVAASVLGLQRREPAEMILFDPEFGLEPRSGGLVGGVGLLQAFISGVVDVRDEGIEPRPALEDRAVVGPHHPRLEPGGGPIDPALDRVELPPDLGDLAAEGGILGGDPGRPDFGPSPGEQDQAGAAQGQGAGPGGDPSRQAADDPDEPRGPEGGNRPPEDRRPGRAVRPGAIKPRASASIRSTRPRMARETARPSAGAPSSRRRRSGPNPGRAGWPPGRRALPGRCPTADAGRRRRRASPSAGSPTQTASPGGCRRPGRSTIGASPRRRRPNASPWSTARARACSWSLAASSSPAFNRPSASATCLDFSSRIWSRVDSYRSCSMDRRALSFFSRTWLSLRYWPPIRSSPAARSVTRTWRSPSAGR